MQKRFDFLVIGTGIAGLSYALKVAGKGSVCLISKDRSKEKLQHAMRRAALQQ
jgi:L-aspartate oxidase